ncbi:dihydrofolate reductase family protein [Nesterenkonia lacusekhoensis]|uniref:Dihydrofolate reductase n=1 Tax=Nesterenkonia lacusekhoensis TaxID=150832 RepID=A0ABS4T2Z9_9MICC|nr:dihydrofolate reductase family protein [Nesterenkonia lacusekhoensis]MBP2318824.1 dihydrofolate reductase [Nesterenkonia lacusekhoensis]
MRRLIITAFVSLDGVMEGPGGEKGYRNAGWTFNQLPHDDAVYELKEREQAEAGALLLGRRSYEAFAPVWPSMAEEFARYNELPKYVVSSSLRPEDLVDGWGEITILRSLDEVARLKDGDGGPLLVQGSSDLGHSLAEAGLVDRYHLLVFPLLLGAGKQLFPTRNKDVTRLQLIEHETFSNGVQKTILDVSREGS